MKGLQISVLLVLLLGVSVAQNSDIVAVASSEAGSIDYTTKQSATIEMTSDGVKVWSFTVRDGGASNVTDGKSTYLIDMNMAPAGSNTVSWGSSIRKAALFSGSSKVAEASSGMFFTNDLDNIIVEVLDGESITLDLYLTFTTVVTDNAQFQFSISAVTDDDEGVYSGGSPITSFAATSSVASGANRVVVTAGQLRFAQTPNFVNPGNDFSITVQAIDSFGNVDLDATNAVGLAKYTGTGTLTGGSAQSLVSGQKTFTTLQYDVEEWPVALVTTNGSGLTNGTSDQFEVTGALLIDDFKGTANGDLTDYGWSVVAAQTGNKAKVAGAGLSKSGYTSSGRYLAATIGDVGEHVYNNLVASQSANSVYLSFMVRFGGTPSSTDGASELIGLATASPSATTDYFGLFSAHSSGGNIRFGVSKTMGETAPTWSGYSYTTSTVYLIVVKYTFVIGAENDVVDLFIDPSLSGTEPSPSLSHTPGGTYGDASSIGSVVLIQQTGSTTMTIDGIRVSTTWSDAALPVQLSSFSASASGMNARLTWSTASESDNAGFEVERRNISDGESRIADYQRIAFVPGAGTSTSPSEYSYTDANLAPGRYAYRIKQVDRDGGSTYYREAEVEVGLTAKAFTLNEAFPNPFNPSTSLDFSLAEAGLASVKVYDVLGREVAQIFNGAAEAGRLYRATWDASSMPSGLYFARLESGGMSAMKRLMLVK